MLERQLESNLISQLKIMGFKEVSFNSNFTMEDNIRECLNKVFNKDYTLDEIKRILRAIDAETSSDLRYAYNFNNILENGIRLQLRGGEVNKENSPYINFIDRTMATNNIFQVAHQITDKGNAHSRYDVTLLINGFPIVQIELKQATVELSEAINQINRYIDTAFTGLFKYLQLFVVSNETETKYGVNTNSKLNKLFMFNWSDEKNVKYNNLTQFTLNFLNIHNLFDMITKYMVRYKSGNKRMIVLRPYQIYAIKAAVKRVTLPQDAKVDRHKNGYIFHTTGSGKTLTSWKCVQMISELPDVSKVVFLVDRKDLDAQTVSEFKSIDSQIDVGDTTNTSALLKAFDKKKAIVTTIQKMHIAIKRAKDSDEQDEAYKNVFGRYRDRRVVFIIDECHRTQYGQMHIEMERYFRNSLYIGFTGTPIYDKNRGTNELTTAELFGNEIHTYRIKDAIQDKNVLGFSVDYYNTISGNKLLEVLDETSSSEIDTAEIILHPERIKNIVSKIFEIHDKKTLNRRYTALFSVSSIDMLIAYYDEFSRQNSEKEEKDKLRVSAIFSTSESALSNTPEGKKSAKFNEIVDDFSKYNAGAIYRHDADKSDIFRSDLVKGLNRVKDNVDIVIVVGIFLTGFDSKMTNTLYLDRNLEYHTLLQALSRTNRVESESKPFGNIVCFRNLRNSVKEAIELFNYGTEDDIIACTFESVLKSLRETINNVNNIVPDDFVMTDKTDEHKKNFVYAMRSLNSSLVKAKQFIEFDWSLIDDILKRDDYNKMIGQLKELREEAAKDENKISVLHTIDFCMELAEHDQINLDYIKNLIYGLTFNDQHRLEKEILNITTKLTESTSESVRYTKDVVERFLQYFRVENRKNLDLVGKPLVSSEEEMRQYIREWVLKDKQNSIKEQAEILNVSENIIATEILKHDITGKINKGDIRDTLRELNSKAGLGKINKLVKDFMLFIRLHKKRYDGLV